MGEHGTYWTTQMNQGRVVVFGVVGDPNGAWGVTIVEVEDEPAAHSLTAEDPAILSGRGFSYDIFAMPNAVTPKLAADSGD